jgi:excisionase family DNA binding protein
MPKRYTTQEAAEVLGLDPSIVRRYCRLGRLGERIGRNFSITESQLKRFQEKPRPRGRRPRGRPSAR